LDVRITKYYHATIIRDEKRGSDYTIFSGNPTQTREKGMGQE
jgi:hypothetical protein